MGPKKLQDYLGIKSKKIFRAMFGLKATQMNQQVVVTGGYGDQNSRYEVLSGKLLLVMQ